MATKQAGGAQSGSGHPRGPEALARSVQLRVSCRRSEIVDLTQLSDAWRVPLSTTAWALLHERIAEIRGRAPEFGELGFAIVAGLDLLGYSPAVMRAAREIVSQREQQSAA